MLAVTLASGVAVANAHVNRQTAPNVYNNGGAVGSPNWQALPSGSTYQCNGTTNVCTGHRSAVGQPVTDIKAGVFQITD